MNRMVSAVQFRDYILIFYENGDIYKMVFDEAMGFGFTYHLLDRFQPRP